MEYSVFLGGTCAGSEWRSAFEPVINCFNPVVPEWTDEAAAKEIKVRKDACLRLYGITPRMQGVYSIAEVVRDASIRPRGTALLLFKKDADAEFTDSQWKSLEAVATMIRSLGAKVFYADSVEDYKSSDAIELLLSCSAEHGSLDIQPIIEKIISVPALKEGHSFECVAIAGRGEEFDFCVKLNGAPLDMVGIGACPGAVVVHLPKAKETHSNIYAAVSKAMQYLLTEAGYAADEIEVVSAGAFVDLVKIKAPGLGVDGYESVLEKRSVKGELVSVLPYRYNEDGVLEVLYRLETTPCWFINSPTVSSITGGVDEGFTVTSSVCKELLEEAGYEVAESDLISLGTCKGTKSSCTNYHLFSVNLTGKTAILAEGDGSLLESKAFCYWGAPRSSNISDPLLSIAYDRLERCL